MKLLKKGAEADIYLAPWDGADAVLKVRRPKPYRNDALDLRLRRQRTAREAQALCTAKSFGVPAPLVHFVDLNECSILMQKMPGKPVHDLPDQKIVEAAGTIGRLAGAMHKNGLMHGDLTTSNFVHHRGMVYALDFGLSQRTVRPEDHAVDLRLIKEILNSAHAGIMARSWRGFLAGYKKTVGAPYYAKITGLVAAIESRGRYARVV